MLHAERMRSISNGLIPYTIYDNLLELIEMNAKRGYWNIELSKKNIRFDGPTLNRLKEQGFTVELLDSENILYISWDNHS